jgi:hypothetical protein
MFAYWDHAPAGSPESSGGLGAIASFQSGWAPHWPRRRKARTNSRIIFGTLPDGVNYARRRDCAVRIKYLDLVQDLHIAVFTDQSVEEETWIRRDGS